MSLNSDDLPEIWGKTTVWEYEKLISRWRRRSKTSLFKLPLGESGGWWEPAQRASRVCYRKANNFSPTGIVLAKFKDEYCPWQKTERGAIWQLPQISIFACPCISHSGKFGAIWTNVLTWCFFCFCFSGIKLNLLNKEVYGYMLQPSGASKTLKDMRISFTHVKLEWFGKSGRL